MADFRIKLSDGIAATVDLYSGNDSFVRYGGLAIPTPRVNAPFVPYTQADGGRITSAKYEDRTISINTRIKGTNLADLKTNIRTIHRLLNDAEERTISGYGGTVYLEYQWGDTAGQSTFFDVLRGDLTLPSDYLSASLKKQYEISNAVINLTCKPFGRYTNQTIPTVTLLNDRFGASLNYQDITTSESYGDVPARMHLKITQSLSVGTSTVWVAKRSGDRYQDNLWRQAEVPDGTANLTAEAGSSFGSANSSMSGGTVYNMRLNKSVSVLGGSIPVYRLDYIFNPMPEGAFRILLRGKTTAPAPDLPNTEMAWGVGWTYGTKTYTPDVSQSEYYSNATANIYETLDLGRLTIPPFPKSNIIPNNNFTLNLFALTKKTLGAAGSYDWTADYLTLLPTDEGITIIPSVKPTDQIAIDGIADPPQVYILSSGGTINAFPDYRGEPFTLGRENTRIYMLKSDGTATTFTSDITFQPQFLSI